MNDILRAAEIESLRGGAAASARAPMPGLIWAMRFHPDGTAEQLPADEPIDDSPHDGWVWLHINLVDQRACQRLASLPLLSPPAVGLLLSTEDHQQIHFTAAGIYGVIADLVREFDHPTFELAQLRFVMTRRLAVTGRRHSLHAVECMRRTILNGRRLASPSALIDAFVEHLADAVDVMNDDVTGKLDKIEERVLNNLIANERQALGRLRHASLQLHRQVSALRTIFHRLERNGMAELEAELRPPAGAIAQRLDALDNDMTGIRDRARLLQEEIAANLAAQTNRHLHALSVLTSLMLPPTLIAGIFGMNVKGLAFIDTDAGFIYALVLAAGSAALAHWIMRRIGIYD
jgi:zinc transporter